MNMPGMDKFMNRMFRKADGVVWDLMTGKIGVQTDEGIATLEGEGDDAQITSNLFDEFGMALPAFAQSTPTANVNVGDIIYRGDRNNIAWVISKNVDKGTFKLMKPNGESTTWTPPKITMLGLESGVMVLRSLMSMLPGGAGGLSGMQNMMMPLMMMGGMDGDSDMMDKMMPMILMSQMGGVNGSDPAAGGMGNMMQMMMMMNMMKGGNSPFGGSSSGGSKSFFDKGSK